MLARQYRPRTACAVRGFVVFGFRTVEGVLAGCRNRVGPGQGLGYSATMNTVENFNESHRDYARIARAIGFLRTHRHDQPDLARLAAHMGLSESQVQRLFSRWAGISPKRFLQHLTVEHAKRTMAETADLLSLSLGSGLSGPGRLHDLFVNMEAMSPGEYRRSASDIEIRYGIGGSPFGPALVAYTGRGICHLSFTEAVPADPEIRSLRATWPRARLVADEPGAGRLLSRVFSVGGAAGAEPLSLWVSGSNFQIQVWRALLRVPFGGLLSYRQLAATLGRPSAARSVGSAVARNPVAFLIPCHRVLRGSGEVGQYHWGETRKAAICAWEGAHTTAEVDPPVTSVLD